MKKIYSLLIIISAALIVGCFDYSLETIIHEPWFCTVNTDGTDLNYLRESVGHHFAFTPDSEKVILFGDNYIYSMNIDGSDFITLNDSIGSSYYAPLPSIAETPEGTKIILGSGKIREIDLESNVLTNLTNTPEDIYEGDPCFSNDGTKITYRTKHYQDSILTINIMNYKGENNNALVEYDISQSADIYLHCPCFSRNDEKVYYLLNCYSGEFTSGLYSVNIDGANNQLISDDVIDYFVFMPNSNEIVFYGYNNIYIMNEDGSGLTSLGEANYGSPIISPDGSKIIFSYNASTWIMNSNGSERHVILSDIDFSTYCKTLAFLSNNKIICSVERRVQ